MMKSGILGAALVWVAAVPAYAGSDITLSGNAAFLTQYVDRGITNSAERPAVQAEFNLTYKEITSRAFGGPTWTLVPVRTDRIRQHRTRLLRRYRPDPG